MLRLTTENFQSREISNTLLEIREEKRRYIDDSWTLERKLDAYAEICQATDDLTLNADSVPGQVRVIFKDIALSEVNSVKAYAALLLSGSLRRSAWETCDAYCAMQTLRDSVWNPMFWTPLKLDCYKSWQNGAFWSDALKETLGAHNFQGNGLKGKTEQPPEPFERAYNLALGSLREALRHRTYACGDVFQASPAGAERLTSIRDEFTRARVRQQISTAHMNALLSFMKLERLQFASDKGCRIVRVDAKNRKVKDLMRMCEIQNDFMLSTTATLNEMVKNVESFFDVLRGIGDALKRKHGDELNRWSNRGGQIASEIMDALTGDKTVEGRVFWSRKLLKWTCFPNAWNEVGEEHACMGFSDFFVAVRLMACYHETLLLQHSVLYPMRFGPRPETQKNQAHARYLYWKNARFVRDARVVCETEGGRHAKSRMMAACANTLSASLKLQKELDIAFLVKAGEGSVSEPAIRCDFSGLWKRGEDDWNRAKKEAVARLKKNASNVPLSDALADDFEKLILIHHFVEGDVKVVARDGTRLTAETAFPDANELEALRRALKTVAFQLELCASIETGPNDDGNSSRSEAVRLAGEIDSESAKTLVSDLRRMWF